MRQGGGDGGKREERRGSEERIGGESRTGGRGRQKGNKEGVGYEIGTGGKEEGDITETRERKDGEGNRV